MTTKITDLDIHETPDTDNPDGRLIDDVYTAGDPPVLITAGSDALCDYPVMDLATLAYKLIRENSDVPSGTPDTQTSSQIYDALINRIQSTSWDHEFSDTDLAYLLDEDGLTLSQATGGSLTPRITAHAKGINYWGVGLDVSYARMARFNIDAATWADVTGGGSLSLTKINLTGFPSNAGSDRILHSSIRWTQGSTWVTTPATIIVEDNGSGIFRTNYMYVPAPGGQTPAFGTSVELVLTFEGTNIY